MRKESVRRPRWVFDAGVEPDPRFTLANERTFLAWMRTSVALLAAGVAAGFLDLGLSPGIRLTLAVGLTATSIVTAWAGWQRWTRTEHAIRQQLPLPSASAIGLIAASLGVLGVAVLFEVTLR